MLKRVGNVLLCQPLILFFINNSLHARAHAHTAKDTDTLAHSRHRFVIVYVSDSAYTLCYW